MRLFVVELILLLLLHKVANSLTLVIVALGNSPGRDGGALVELILAVRALQILIGIDKIGNADASGGASGEGSGTLKRSLILVKLGHLVDELGAASFDHSADSPGSHSEGDRGDVHRERQRSGAEEVADGHIANHEVLDVELGEEDDPEP